MSTAAIDRRKALKALAFGGIGAGVVAAWVARLGEVAFAHGAQGVRPGAGAREWSPQALTPHQNETVITVSELIIPHTETAGARAARVNEFIDTVLADAPKADRDRFVRGLDWIDARSTERHGATFVAATPPQQIALLTEISGPAAEAPADKVGTEFFQAIKTLTITGYYTSEVGMREELGDDGRMAFTAYAGCTHPEHKGEGAPGVRP